jgi:hypothetical protein
MAAKLDIANHALRLCETNTIASLTEDSVEAQIVRDMYDLCLAYCLSLHQWSFAKTTTAQLSKLTGGDTHDGYERYARPAGANIITRLYTNFDMEIPFRTDEDELVTLIDVDTASGVFVNYVTTPDEGVFTGTFTLAFTTYLASAICEPITASSTKGERLRAIAMGANPDIVKGLMGQAMKVDTRQAGQQRLFDTEECSMLTERGFFRRSTGWRRGY